MSRAVNVLAVLLLVCATVAFGYGLMSIGDREDMRAFYLLLVGALALRASTEMLRPRGAT